jgi:hypothetical protein
MQNQGSIQKKKTCKTCPFLKEIEMPLDRKTLERTIVSNLNNGYIHPCHTTQENMCTGYLAFIHHKQQSEGGLQSNMVCRYAVSIGLVREEDIPEIDVFNAMEEMLESHDKKYEELVFRIS